MKPDEPDIPEDSDGGSMFTSTKILIGMVVVALLAVLIGMGGQRSAHDKRAEVFAADQKAAERADRVAGFKDEEATR